MNHKYHSQGGFYMVWKIFGALSLVLAAVAALVSATTAPEYKTGAEWVIALLFVALAVFLFWQGAKSSAGKKAKRQGGNGTYMTEQELQQIQGGVLPALASVPVVLGEGEVAHFFAPARRYVTKKKAVGRTGSGGGVSVRVAKGVSVRSGGGASQTVYDDVTDAFDGLAVLTNRPDRLPGKTERLRLQAVHDLRDPAGRRRAYDPGRGEELSPDRGATGIFFESP